MESFGKRLIRLRKKDKIKQKDLAKLLGLPLTKVFRWENEIAVNPRMSDLLKLSQFFGVNIDYLVTGDEDANKLYSLYSQLLVSDKRSLVDYLEFLANRRL